MHAPVSVRRRQGGRHARPSRLGRWWRHFGRLSDHLDLVAEDVVLLRDVQEAMGDEIERLRERVGGDEPPPGASRPPLRLVGEPQERPSRRALGSGDAQPVRRVS
jgi:hypothetical protein